MKTQHSLECPICGKAGIGDFRSKKLICPQCDTDLSPFFTLHSLSGLDKSKGRFAIISSVLLMLMTFATGLWISEEYEIFDSKKDLIKGLTDSINSKNLEIVKLQNVIADSKPGKAIIHYQVKKGDNLSSLSKMFYDDESKYIKIAEENGIEKPDEIIAGQTLIINLPQP